MKKSAGFLVLISLVFGVAVYFTMDSSKKKVAQKTLLSISKSSIGSEEDPGARARFEWRRLRDPQTDQIPRNIRAHELEFAKLQPTRESFAPIKNGRDQVLLKSRAWTLRGPMNVGGRTRALAADVTNENILLAAGVSGGIWKSTNGGNSWTKTTQPDQLHLITSIAQDTRSGKTSTWYASTGEFNPGGHFGTPFRGDVFFKSTDGGNTWTNLPSTQVRETPQSFDSGFDYTYKIITDPTTSGSDVVYAATFGGIYRSTNGATSWARVLGVFSNDAPQYTDITIASNGVLYATLSEASNSGNPAPKGLYRSTNGTA